MSKSFKEEKHFIKILDIGYITVLYFTLAYFVAIFVNKIAGKFDEKHANQKSTWLLFIEAMIHMYVMGILIYLLRYVVVQIPSPFHGVKGLDHYALPELKSSFVLSFILLFYQSNLRMKLEYLAKRMVGK